MKTLSERQEGLLETVISDYIRLAQPISSQYLEERYDFGVSPATIRNELLVLSEGGYLMQPHTSAGRVPTDKGYRFFVDGVSKKESAKSALGGLGGKWEDIFEREITDALEFAAFGARALANESSGLAALYMESAPLFFKEGWEDVLQEPEFEEQDSIRSFMRFLNDFERNVHNMSLEDGIQIFIGKENPFSKVTDFSIMIAECDFPGQGRAAPHKRGEPRPHRGRGLVALLGPKRMAYPKNIHLLKAFSQIWKNSKT